MNENKNNVQLIWGILLLSAGVGVFFEIPHKMQMIEQIEHFSSGLFFIRFCFYLIGVLLVAGGGKKIFSFLREKIKENE